MLKSVRLQTVDKVRSAVIFYEKKRKNQKEKREGMSK